MIDDTIASIATAPGEAGISIIRMSGPQALDILDKIFLPKKKNSIKEYPQRRLVYGHVIKDDKKVIDEVLAVYMKAPYTYTREDVVEINCHGGMIPIRNILELILRNGARAAEPGEFTKRAFLNGRIDLAQAEAVMDLISAKTDKGFDVALGQLDGSLSNRVQDIRENILEVLAHLQVSIDYTEEDIEEITYPELLSQSKAIREKIKRLLDTSNTGKIIREGLKVVIVGKPNVGKSSLLNALLKESRAIVTDIPGTTRDVIEEFVSVKGIPVRIIDTAGIRETDDVVERIGVQRSKESFNKADLVILMLDASSKLTNEDKEIMNYVKNKEAIVLVNKIDLPKRISIEEIKEILPNKKVIETSIEEEKGIEELENEIVNMVYGGEVKAKDTSYVTNVRHKHALEKALKSIEEAIEAINMKMFFDVISVDLNDCGEFLGEITGDTIEEDVIDKIFSNFCLGK